MTHETKRAIPATVAEIMRSEEIKNMRNLRGWVVGNVELVVNGDRKDYIEDVWIEIFDGNGTAGEFDGCRFMGVDESGSYRESYAFIGDKPFDPETDTGWHVDTVTVSRSQE